MEKKKEKINNHSLLACVKLTRSILKRSIMTQVYDVKVNGIYNQLASKLEKITENVINDNGKTIEKITYKVPSKKGSYIVLDYLDLFQLAQIVHNEIFKVYPSLRNIYDYFINMVRLMLNLNIPVVWFTPSGTKITQFYKKCDVKKVKLTFFGRTKTTILKEWKDD